MSFEYKVTELSPSGFKSPMPEGRDWENWLIEWDNQGWEYVGQINRWWHDRDIPQMFYVFRRTRNAE